MTIIEKLTILSRSQESMWFEKLTDTERKKYLKEHPKSRLAQLNTLHSQPLNYYKIHQHIKKTSTDEEKDFTDYFKHNAATYRKTYHALNEDEKSALRDYKGADYTAINNHFRKGQSDPKIASVANHLSNALSKAKLKNDLVGIRGLAARPEWISNNCKPGTVIEDKGFMSVSIRPQVVHNYANEKKAVDDTRQSVLMQLHIPKGSHCLPLSPHELGDAKHADLENQCEYLLQHGSKFVVKSVKRVKINGQKVIALNMEYQANDHPNG